MTRGTHASPRRQYPQSRPPVSWDLARWVRLRPDRPGIAFRSAVKRPENAGLSGRALWRARKRPTQPYLPWASRDM
jgi:hypothetical protein